MPIYEETWKQSDYIPRRHLYLQELPKNHLEKIKTVKFEFSDYKVYDQFACFPYERMLIQCFNNYGMIDAMKNLQCTQISQFFRTCLRTNALFGHLKKSRPEFFLNNKYSRNWIYDENEYEIMNLLIRLINIQIQLKIETLFMKQYEILYSSFSSRFKQIRSGDNMYIGKYLLMRDNQTKKKVIVKSITYETIEEISNILQNTATLIPLINDNAYGNFCKFIGYTSFENRNTKYLYLIYMFNQSTLDEQIKNMHIHKRLFTQKDILRFIEQTICNLVQLERINLHHQCLNADNILVEKLDSIDCSFRMLYLQANNQVLESLIKNQTQVSHKVAISYDQCNYYNFSQVQLKQISKRKAISYEDKIISDRECLGLLALKMINHQQHNIYTHNQNHDLQWNNHQIQNIIKNSNYSKNLTKIIQILLYQKQFYCFQKLQEVFIQTFPQNFKSSRLTNSRKSKISNDGHSYFKQTPKSNSQHNLLKLSREKNFASFSPFDRLPSLSIEKIEQKILFDSDGNPRQRISQKIYADGGKYIGQFEKDIRSGKGVYYYVEGDVYGGEWKDNVMSGHGLYLFNNGETYDGQVVNGLKEGKGTYIYANGNKYIGQWKNDKKYGQGYYEYNHRGDTYEGHFEDGLREGKGIYKWKNGNIYDGKFQKNKKEGEGQALLSTGTKIIGKWVNDNLDGIVKVKYKKGDEIVAEIRDNAFNGYGKYSYIQGIQYQGQFKNNKKTGKCQINFQNGDWYKGQIKDGKFEGKGIYFYNNQSIRYQGDWQNGLQHGKGTLIFENKSVMTLQWNLGKPSDKGSIAYPNGDKYQGKINSMGRHGKGTYQFHDGRVIEAYFNDGQVS